MNKKKMNYQSSTKKANKGVLKMWLPPPSLEPGMGHEMMSRGADEINLLLLNQPVGGNLHSTVLDTEQKCMKTIS